MNFWAVCSINLFSIYNYFLKCQLLLILIQYDRNMNFLMLEQFLFNSYALILVYKKSSNNLVIKRE